MSGLNWPAALAVRSAAMAASLWALLLTGSCSAASGPTERYDVVCVINSCEVSSGVFAVTLVRHDGEIGLRPAMVRGQVDHGYANDPLAMREGREEAIVRPSQAKLFPADWRVDERDRTRNGELPGHLLIGGNDGRRTDLITHWDRASDTARPITVRALLTILESQPEFYVESAYRSDLDVVVGLRARVQSRPFVAAMSEALEQLDRRP